MKSPKTRTQRQPVRNLLAAGTGGAFGGLCVMFLIPGDYSLSIFLKRFLLGSLFGLVTSLTDSYLSGTNNVENSRSQQFLIGVVVGAFGSIVLLVILVVVDPSLPAIGSPD